MTRRLLLIAAFFSPRRVVKFLGLRGGKRRSRQDPIAWVLLSVAVSVVAVKVALVTVLHLTLFKAVSR